ncbi:transposase [Rhabdochlamydiaceae symbiont of Dictyostelium giganteum]|uniref:transposase n=1 Tax=Rhabdochlamydiaceae symbiont of Dictyostelium giganteum TaxID=3342349 RepID=UPI00384F0503
MTEEKKIKGRKRHLLVDHLGFPLALELTAANVGDREGFKLLLDKYKEHTPNIVFADSGYKGKDFEQECMNQGVKVQPVPRNEGWCLKTNSLKVIQGFQVVAKRWIVERSFAWLGKYRRMVKDYELILTVSKAMIWMVFIRLLLSRLGN